MVFPLFPQMWEVLFEDVMRNLSLISSAIKIAECQMEVAQIDESGPRIASLLLQLVPVA